MFYFFQLFPRATQVNYCNKLLGFSINVLISGFKVISHALFYFGDV